MARRLHPLLLLRSANPSLRSRLNSYAEHDPHQGCNTLSLDLDRFFMTLKQKDLIHYFCVVGTNGDSECPPLLHPPAVDDRGKDRVYFPTLPLRSANGDKTAYNLIWLFPVMLHRLLNRTHWKGCQCIPLVDVHRATKPPGGSLDVL